ncbi:MAG TPA: YqzL family protein [Clostridia bacterium]|nr:YqzL family protein [Clostridia bacterium]
MIKKLAWNTFKNTGNIDTYLEIVKLEDLKKIKGE